MKLEKVGKVNSEIFEYCKDVWDKINQHPFVEAIGNGTLDIEKFKYYIIQDNLYLLDYAKVFAMGMVKSQSEEDLRSFDKLLRGIIGSEMDAHNEFLASIDLSQDIIENTEANLITEAYTKYMLGIGTTGGPCQVAAAILACAWTYLYIGDHVSKMNGYKDSDFCKHWVDIYTSEDFLQDVIDNTNLVEKLSEGYNQEQIDDLKKIVRNCSEYEYLFWDICWKQGKLFDHQI
ncbi:MAG: thiaminase II [Anaerovoracaceae bacterium]